MGTGGFNSEYMKGVQIRDAQMAILPIRLNPMVDEKRFLTPVLAGILMMRRLNPIIDETRFPNASSAISSTIWPPYPGVDLRLGMQGPSISQVQEKLNELGANPHLATDGAFGPLTAASVIAFQKANGLTPDGIVNLITWNTLFSSQPAPLPKSMIALTFDDGPAPLTERLLDILERYGARATFFVTGQLVKLGRNTVARAAKMGSEIAGHTWMHIDLRQLSNQEVAETIQSTSAVIESVTGSSPPIYRPPFGFTNANVRRVSGELGYSIVNWTFDTLDWLYRDADVIYNTIMNNVINDDIILLHDIHVATIDAMERAIPSLIAEGFQLVTVSELLAYKYGELEPGIVYGIPRGVL